MPPARGPPESASAMPRAVAEASCSTRHWRCAYFDLGTPEGFEAYFGRPVPDDEPTAIPRLLGAPGHPSLTAALNEIRAALCPPSDAGPLTPLPSAENILRVSGRMLLSERGASPGPAMYPGLLLHGSGEADSGAARHNRHRPLRRPVSDNGRAAAAAPIEPGTAIHSALKRQARFVLSALGVQPARMDPFMEELFGSQAPGAGRHKTSVPSKVTENEPAISGAVELPLPRVRLNPLTQGAVDGSLLFDEVLSGGHARWEIRVLDPTKEQSGLLWLILRDLEDGHGPGLGAGTSVGHGRRVLDGTLIQRGTAPSPDAGAGPWRGNKTVTEEVGAFLAWASQPLNEQADKAPGGNGTGHE